MPIRSCIFLVLFSIVSYHSVAQISNQKCKWIVKFDVPFRLDSLSVIPESIEVKGVNDSLFSFNYELNNGLLNLKNYSGKDSLRLCYITFPTNFNASYSNRPIDEYDSTARFDKVFSDSRKITTEQQEELFHTENLTKSGSISRTVSFGNTQNVFVNSTLNLNLDGKLTHGLNIRASITDQNIPIQPNGTTQQLQDFDNVFVELYNEKGSLTAGDVVLQNQSGYFLKYYKNVQGGRLKVSYKDPLGLGHAETSAAISVAKGQFASEIIEVAEGVSGPYQIPSPNQSQFVIVLANSEKVYLDGKLLKRGYNYDYIIDYNVGEITFTNQILITKFSRVRIDFEYSDNTYSRSILALNHYQSSEKVDFFLNYYQEKDNKNNPLLFDLSADDRLRLINSGDASTIVIANGFDSISFNQNILNYKLVDTLDLDGKLHQVFVLSFNPDSAFYQVSFTEVGMGNGDYIELPGTLNGRSFIWVSPVNGESQGNFALGRTAQAPNQRRLITAGTRYRLNSFDQVDAEFAISKYDQNLFSFKDDEDNSGMAIKGGFASEGRSLLKTGYKLNYGLSLEYDHADFNPIDRFRYVEFDRDWSLSKVQVDSIRAKDLILSASFGMSKDEMNGFNYEIVKRNRGKVLNGVQHLAEVDKDLGNIHIGADLFLMNGEQPDLESEWKRLNASISYKTRYFTPGYSFHSDRNILKTDSDSVISTAMNYESHRFFIASGDSSEHHVKLDYNFRTDRSPFEGNLVDNAKSQTLQATYGSPSGKNNQVRILSYYRILKNKNFSEKTEETISGRFDYIGRLFEDHLNTEINYRISNGRELRRTISYVEVPVGQGTHTWRDLNEDGIQDLTEFFEAINADERNFIRILLPTNQFVTAFDNQVNILLKIRMPLAWYGLQGLRGFLAKFTNNTSWTASNKITEKNLGSRLGPFVKKINDNDLLSSRESFRSILFFDRGNPKFGASLSFNRNQLKQLLQNGFETSRIKTYTMNFRINVSRVYQLKLSQAIIEKDNQSDFLNDRTFDIRAWQFNPELTWQPSSSFQLITSYSRKVKQTGAERNDVGAASDFNEIKFEVRSNQAVKSSFSAMFKWVEISFRGNVNTPVGYELLEALSPGTNFTWNAIYQRKISSGLQLNLIYEARKSERSDIIQLGRVQVSALF